MRQSAELFFQFCGFGDQADAFILLFESVLLLGCQSGGACERFLLYFLKQTEFGSDLCVISLETPETLPERLGFNLDSTLNLRDFDFTFL